MYQDYTLVFDVDGTLCPIKTKEESYEDLIPFSEKNGTFPMMRLFTEKSGLDIRAFT